MIGLAGLELTSATGKKFQWMPMARDSSAGMRPGAPAYSRFLGAPNAMAWGEAVGPRRRMESPRSKSAAKMRGRPESCWSWLVRPAVPYGSLYIRDEPSTGTLTAKPPTWYLRRFSRRTRYSGLLEFRNCTRAQGMIN